MARKHKCAYCHKEIEKPDDIDNGEVLIATKKYAHRQCFQIYVAGTATKKREMQANRAAQKKNAPKQITVNAVRKGKTEAEYQEERQFLADVKNVLKSGFAPVETLSIQKNYEEKYKITKEQFLMAIKYFYVIKGNTPTEHPFGIIPYVINEAINFYSHLDDVKKQNNEFDITAMYKQERVVYVSSGDESITPEIDINTI